MPEAKHHLCDAPLTDISMSGDWIQRIPTQRAVDVGCPVMSYNKISGRRSSSELRETHEWGDGEPYNLRDSESQEEDVHSKLNPEDGRETGNRPKGTMLCYKDS